jgi:CxxC motif-containing protein (DUF1111 family)
MQNVYLYTFWQWRFIMQRFAAKPLIVTILLCSAALSGSLTFAATNGLSQQPMSVSQRLYASAGCMGCHQGDAMTIDESTDKSHAKHQHRQDQKQHASNDAGSQLPNAS